MNEKYENDVIVEEENQEEVIDLIEEDVPEVEYYSHEKSNGLGKGLLIIGGVVAGAAATMLIKPVRTKIKAKIEEKKEARKEKKALKKTEVTEEDLIIDNR